MFSVDDLIGDCLDALEEVQPALAVREVVSRAVSEPDRVAAAFDTPQRAELVPLYASPELTVLRLVWAPGMRLPPHNHLMWAVIGLYGGEEDNRFFRRGPSGLDPSGAKRLVPADAVALGDDTIHAVENPLSSSFTGAIHVYGGDFLNKPRSLWDPETLAEEPATGMRMRELFDAANGDL